MLFLIGVSMLLLFMVILMITSVAHGDIMSFLFFGGIAMISLAIVMPKLMITGVI